MSEETLNLLQFIHIIKNNNLQDKTGSQWVNDIPLVLNQDEIFILYWCFYVELCYQK